MTVSLQDDYPADPPERRRSWKTIEDMHAVWTMENEQAHDAGRESESTHCTGRCWGCDPLEICLRTVVPIKPSTASTSLCRCDRMDVQFSRGLDQLSVCLTSGDDDDDAMADAA